MEKSAITTPFPQSESFVVHYLEYYETEEEYAQIEANKKWIPIDGNSRPYPLYILSNGKCQHAKFKRPNEGGNFVIRRFPGVRFQIVSEQIGHVFNRRLVALYLHLTFPHRTFNVEEVELAHYIMGILLKKATHIENMDHMEKGRTDFCYDDSMSYRANDPNYLVNPSVDKNGRCNDVRIMFNTQVIFIPCYGLGRQHDGTDWRRLSQYSLMELLSDKQKLRIFFDYWRTVPDYESVFAILRHLLGLPADICNLIIAMAARRYHDP